MILGRAFMPSGRLHDETQAVAGRNKGEVNNVYVCFTARALTEMRP